MDVIRMDPILKNMNLFNYLWVNLFNYLWVNYVGDSDVSAMEWF